MVEEKQKFTLSENDLAILIEAVFAYFTEDKEPKYTCDFILGWNDEKNSNVVLNKRQMDYNRIILNKKALFMFHPCYTRIQKLFPNAHESIIGNDINKVYFALIDMLTKKGYSLIIEDDFGNPEETLDLIAFIRNKGYHTNVTLLRSNIIYQQFKMIRNYVIDLVTKTCNVPLEQKTFPVDAFIIKILQKEIFTLFMLEPTLTGVIYLDKGNISKHLYPEVHDNDETFEFEYDSIFSFVRSNQDYLNKDDYIQIIMWLENLKKIYYDALDLELLAPKSR